MFQITLSGEEDFFATTVGGANFDTQLFLFDEDGILVAQNDDSSGTFQSTLPASTLESGTYFLAISSFNNDPVGTPPVFPGNGGDTGNYTIDLAGVQAATFSLGASPEGLPSGTSISFGNDLVAIVQGVSPLDLNLNSSSFNFV
ncbi:DVUA0089 family protein [Funiculus sociatus GB1-A4]